MAGSDPGDRIPSAGRPRARRLSEPPSARFARRPSDSDPGGGSGAHGTSTSALRGPLLRAISVAILGAVGLVAVGGILASTFGLLFIGGAMGAVVGLVIARAAAPEDGRTPTPRRTVVRLAVGVALAGVVVGAAGLWLLALAEGGVLGPLDFLWTTFGPLVPGVALIAALTAWWGATAGPVQR